MWRDCDRRELVGLLDEDRLASLQGKHPEVLEALDDAADAHLWASDFVSEDRIRRFDEALLGLLQGVAQ